MISLRWIALAALALGVGNARAETQSVSYSTWVIAGNVVTLRYMLPISEARALIGPDVPVATVAKLGDYLLRQVTVRSASGQCPALDQGYDLGRVDPLAVGSDFYGFEIFYRCDDPRQMVLQDAALFSRTPDHLNIARIDRDGRVVEHVFTAASQQLQLPDDGMLVAPGLGTWLRMGAQHILHSADRLCFVLGLVLLIRRRRDVGYLILALTIGYGLSMLISRGGWVSPRASLVEAFVGLLVILTALAVVLVRAERRRAIVAGWIGLLLLAAVVTALARHTAAASILVGGAALSAGLFAISVRQESSRFFWPLLAGLLGFVDGFVWASLIEPAQLPQRTQVWMLTGLDLGAVLAASAVAALLAGGLLLLRVRRLESARALINELCTAGLAGCGTFWLASRLWV